MCPLVGLNLVCAADALTGATVAWEGLPPETRRVFLDVAMAVHLADRIEGAAEGSGFPPRARAEGGCLRFQIPVD